MKFTAETQALQDAIKTAALAVDRKNTIPILGHVHLTADKGSITLRGTDLDVEVDIKTVADVDTKGSVCVPALLLDSILKKLPKDSSVVLETGKDSATLRCGRSRFKLMTLPVEDFPSFPEFNGNHRFTMPAADLGALVNNTEFAMSKETSRYYLCGIYLHRHVTDSGTVLRACSTDGHRLASADVALPTGADGMPGVIVPRRTVEHLAKINGADIVEVGVSDRTIEITTGDVTLKSKLIDGTFPDYHRVVPKNNDKTATVDVDLFKDAVARVTSMSSESAKSLKLDFKPGMVKFSVNNPDTGSSEDEMEIEWESNEPLTIGFNGGYLNKIFDIIGTDQAKIELSDSGSPVLIKPTNDDSRYFVLMPMRV